MNLVLGIIPGLYELAANLEMEVVEGNFTPYDAYNAEEAFLASFSPTILPMRSINGAGLMKEIPRPITKRLIQGWNKMVGLEIAEQVLGHLESAECDRLIQGVANQVRQVTARHSRRKLRKA